MGSTCSLVGQIVCKNKSVTLARNRGRECARERGRDASSTLKPLKLAHATDTLVERGDVQPRQNHKAQRVLVLLLDMNAKPHANASLSDKRHVAHKRGTASLAECAVGNVH